MFGIADTDLLALQSRPEIPGVRFDHVKSDEPQRNRQQARDGPQARDNHPASLHDRLGLTRVAPRSVRTILAAHDRCRQKEILLTRTKTQSGLTLKHFR